MARLHQSIDRKAVKLAACGTLSRLEHEENPKIARRLRLLIEMGILFIGLPIAVRYAVFQYRIPLILLLQPIFLGLIAYLLIDPRFNLRTELSRGIRRPDLAVILGLFTVATTVLATYVYARHPELFLSLIRHRPEVWLLVLCFYPMLSVIPQELVYRTFFFHRYGAIFADRRWLAIAANGSLFGLGHIIFGNWIAILGTFVVGCVIAYRYEKSRSFWTAWLEHTLYGWLVFTIGIGRYFFTGVSNMN